MLDRIQIDSRVSQGGGFVLKLLGDGYTAEAIVREYPELEVEDGHQATKYRAWLASGRSTIVR